MFSIQPLGLGSAEEELGAVRVGTSVGHGEDSWPSVLQLKVLVLKLCAVNGLSSSSITSSKVSSLTHKVGNDTMEGPFTAQCASAESSRP